MVCESNRRPKTKGLDLNVLVIDGSLSDPLTARDEDYFKEQYMNTCIEYLIQDGFFDYR